MGSKQTNITLNYSWPCWSRRWLWFPHCNTWGCWHSWRFCQCGTSKIELSVVITQVVSSVARMCQFSLLGCLIEGQALETLRTLKTSKGEIPYHTSIPTLPKHAGLAVGFHSYHGHELVFRDQEPIHFSIGFLYSIWLNSDLHNISFPHSVSNWRLALAWQSTEGGLSAYFDTLLPLYT